VSLKASARHKRKSLTLYVLRANVRAIALHRRLGLRTIALDRDRIQMRWNTPIRPRQRMPPTASDLQRTVE
jgi:hypothetical protein